MNPNFGKGSTNAFNFDLGLGSGKSNKSLNDQKPKPPGSSYSTMQQQQQPKPAWQYGNNKPSWTHQPAPVTHSGLNGPTSMVGDITGRSWNSSGGGGGIGIVDKNPNLFGDLVGSALGTSKSGGIGNANVPLKNVGAVKQEKSVYSMGGMANSLPKTGGGVGNVGNNVKQESFGSYTSGAYSATNSGKTGIKCLPQQRPIGGANGNGGFMSSSKDPFGSLFDLGMKPGGGIGGMKSGIGKSSTAVDDSFGEFKTAPKPGGISSGSFDKYSVADDPFGGFVNASKPSNSAFPSGQPSKVSGPDLGDFEMPSQNQPQAFSTGVDPLDMLFPSASLGSTASGNTQPTEVDWGIDSELNGTHDDGVTTTELEGLPPPPANVSASAAKSKGLDNYKQGQFADAIKWLSWAIVLLEKSGDNVAEVLSSRASCYKEVGEYKKAVADCTKVLETDIKNVNVLVQRALLYESIEKYKLGAEDLRAVLKIDPMNRVARSTVHRLTKMAD